LKRLSIHILLLSAAGLCSAVPDHALRGLRGLEDLAASLLISAGLTLVGVLYWKRQNLRHRIWSLRISPQSLHELINSGHTPLIVDLRSPLDMLPDPRIIPGAIRLTQEEIPVSATVLPRHADIVLYCTCPRERTSVDTALRLLDAGFTRIRLLSGGFQAWKQLGYELQNATDMIRWPSQTAAMPGAQPAGEIPSKL
jgi:rhodanese-related sulfurtransferase